MAPFKKTGGFKGGSPAFTRGGGDRPHFANKGFAGRDSRGSGDRPAQMFTATCAQCRKTCEVPFRPNGEKPVFCRDCFSEKRGAHSGGDFTRREQSREFPHHDRDRAPAAAFDRKPADTRLDELKRQVDTVNHKLDSLTRMIEGLATTHAMPEVQAPEESLAKVVKKIAKKAAVSKSVKTTSRGKK